ncbi:unnamed protein product [Gordionus sp. m RMFG-2023]
MTSWLLRRHRGTCLTNVHVFRWLEDAGILTLVTVPFKPALELLGLVTSIYVTVESLAFVRIGICVNRTCFFIFLASAKVTEHPEYVQETQVMSSANRTLLGVRLSFSKCFIPMPSVSIAISTKSANELHLTLAIRTYPFTAWLLLSTSHFRSFRGSFSLYISPEN